MPKGRYFGLIKDYDGGTMMECYLYPNVNYLDVGGMLAAQRAFLQGVVLDRAQSHVVREGGVVIRDDDDKVDYPAAGRWPKGGGGLKPQDRVQPN